MTKKRFFIASCAFLVLLAGATSYAVIKKSDSNYYYALARYEIPRFNIVSKGILRGSQPQKQGFAILKAHYHVKTVLDLRNDEEHNKSEKKIVEGLGMRYMNIPMDGREEQDIKKIEQCLNIITDKSNQPIFVHCKAGKDRTGLVIAAYRIKYNNWAFEQAYEEMLAFDYDTRFLKLKESLEKWNEYVRQR